MFNNYTINLLVCVLQLGELAAGNVKIVPATSYDIGLNEDKVTHYIEHPVLVHPHHEGTCLFYMCSSGVWVWGQ